MVSTSHRKITDNGYPENRSIQVRFRQDDRDTTSAMHRDRRTKQKGKGEGKGLNPIMLAQALFSENVIHVFEATKTLGALSPCRALEYTEKKMEVQAHLKIPSFGLDCAAPCKLMRHYITILAIELELLLGDGDTASGLAF